LVSAGCACLPPHGPGQGDGRYGGGAPSRQPPPIECKAGGTCTISVDVVTVIGNHAAQTYIVAPDAEIAKGNHGADGKGVAIRWHLTNHDYTFRADSIAFYETSSTEQFKDPKAGERGEDFHFTDRNTDSHGYGYQIKVYNRSNGNWLTLDPYIWNNN
ncbi:MAG: hypothetical protein JSS46_10465, partial [Proteobacteria bacterium]|nr:hypothetical protein [Pseudomonadota bacterium]